MAEGNGLRRDQGHASLHHSSPQPLLQLRLDGGQIGTTVDTGQQRLIELYRPCLQPRFARQRHHVGHVELTGGVIVAQLPEQVEEHGVADQHQPAVTPGQRKLFGRGIALFDDGRRATLAVENDPAIARWLPASKVLRARSAPSASVLATSSASASVVTSGVSA